MSKSITYRECFRNKINLQADETRNKVASVILKRLPGGVTDQRLEKLSLLLSCMDDDDLDRLRFTICSDEKTGQRFGRRACRIGRCLKLGHSSYKYQIWADWSQL